MRGVDGGFCGSSLVVSGFVYGGQFWTVVSLAGNIWLSLYTGKGDFHPEKLKGCKGLSLYVPCNPSRVALFMVTVLLLRIDKVSLNGF